MKVILAESAGFCMGVRRAVDMTLEAASNLGPGQKLVTYGEIIHNPQVVELLRSKGVEAVHDEDAAAGCIVTIRSHGIPPQERARLEEKGESVIDATCPHVLRIHKIIDAAVKSGREAIIFGDRGHSEVVALKAVGGDHAHVVENVGEFEKLPSFEKVSLVAQTTQEVEKYEKIIDSANGRYEDLEIHKTICLATRKRQEEAATLSREVDAVVVVGGRKSANTNRLAEIAAESGRPVFHVEEPSELAVEELGRFKIVGVTAGASTPNWMITAVIDRLHEISAVSSPGALRFFYGAAAFLRDSSIYVSLGAAFLAYASCLLQEISPKIEYLAAAFMYIFFAHNFGRYIRQVELSRLVKGVGRRTRFSARAMIPASIAAMAGVLALSIFEGPWAFVVAALAIGTTLIYVIAILPSRSRIRKLLGLPGSKDLGISVGWAAMVVLFPFVAEGGEFTPIFMAAFAACMVLVFTRSTLLEVRNTQHDMMVGKETVPVALGIGATRVLLVALNTLLCLGLGVLWFQGSVNDYGLAVLITGLYAYVYLWLYHKRIVSREYLCEFVVDGKFYLAGLAALVISYLQ